MASLSTSSVFMHFSTAIILTTVYLSFACLPGIRGKCNVSNSYDLPLVSWISIRILWILRLNNMFFKLWDTFRRLCYLHSSRMFSLMYLYLYFRDYGIMMSPFSFLVFTSECPTEFLLYFLLSFFKVWGRGEYCNIYYLTQKSNSYFKNICNPINYNIFIFVYLKEISLSSLRLTY